MIDFRNDFAQHCMLYLLTLFVLGAGTLMNAPKEVLSPIANGLGMALPALLGGHALASGVRAWKKDDDKDTEKKDGEPCSSRS